ncbi:MAG: hypothetical protein MSG64_00460 [Pyrinomonadaceae bacterium MAG19_C2-C3]|nr:hypothetical protein [Pyrinomonadaceae bacterium MAG19_C2-C3]
MDKNTTRIHRAADGSGSILHRNQAGSLSRRRGVRYIVCRAGHAAMEA